MANLTRQQIKIRSRVQSTLLLLVALAVLAGVVLLIVLRSAPATMSEDESSEPAAITDSVSSDGEHEITVGVDESGAILHNGTGTLLDGVSEAAVKVSLEENTFSQVTLFDLQCRNVPVLVSFKQSGRKVEAKVLNRPGKRGGGRAGASFVGIKMKHCASVLCSET